MSNNCYGDFMDVSDPSFAADDRFQSQMRTLISLISDLERGPSGDDLVELIAEIDATAFSVALTACHRYLEL
jgi:hypothetical protein